MNKFGIVVRNLLPAQQSYYLIRNLNKYLNEYYTDSIIVFTKYATIPCIKPDFCTMRAEELWGFEHPIITTDIETTQKALSVPNRHNIYMYVYDLEWIKKPFPSMKFEFFYNVYCNNRIQLIARNQKYQNLIQSIWNKPPLGISQDFDIKQMLNLVQNHVRNN